MRTQNNPDGIALVDFIKSQKKHKASPQVKRLSDGSTIVKSIKCAGYTFYIPRDIKCKLADFQSKTWRAKHLAKLICKQDLDDPNRVYLNDDASTSVDSSAF